MLFVDSQAYSTEYALLLIACLILFGTCGFLWGIIPGHVRKQVFWWLFGISVTVLCFGAAFSQQLDWDEVEHLHVAWLMAQGQIPFKDFFQHHTPTFWLLLMPLMKVLPPGAYIVEVARTLALLCSLVTGWLLIKIVRELTPQKYITVTALLLWALVLGAFEFCQLRPDLLGNVLILWSLLIIIRRRGVMEVVASGLLIGLAASLTPKYAPLLGMYLVCVWFEAGGWQRAIKHSILHVVGFVTGLIPMVIWLVQVGQLSAVKTWVIDFNKDPKLQVLLMVPLVLLSFSIIHWVRIRTDQFIKISFFERMLITGSIITMLMFAIQPFHKSQYGMQMLVLLLIVTGASEFLNLTQKLIQTRHYILIGLLLGLLASRPVVHTFYFLYEWEYYWGRQQIGQLLEQAHQGPVFLVAPAHPIFVYDATDIYHPWQWNKWLERPEIQDRLTGLVDQIISRRPTVITAGHVRSSSAKGQATAKYIPGMDTTSEWLLQNDCITQADAQKLERFLYQNYRLVKIVWEYCWVRDDIPLINEAKPVE